MKVGSARTIALAGLLATAVARAPGFSLPDAGAQGATSQQGATDATQRGAEILAAAAAAAGGEAVKKLESVECKLAGDANTPNGAFPIEVKIQVAYPDRVRLETDFGMGSLTTGFDGKSGWFSGPQGTYDVPADMNPETLRSIDLVGGLGLYKKVLSGKAQAEFSGENEIAGQKVLQVEWQGPSGKIKLFFDAQTKLLVAAKYRALTMQGAFEEERRWSDFREVDGVKFPYRWMTYRDGGLYTDLTAKEFKTNPKMEAGNFARPQ